jgi:hypothetical protein
LHPIVSAGPDSGVELISGKNGMKRLSRIYVSGVIAGAVALTACKPRQDQTSRVKDLNPGQSVNDDEGAMAKMKDGRKVVVIYYANDTFGPKRGDPQYETLDDLVNLLETEAAKEEDKATKELLQRVQRRLVKDWDEFRTSVSNNVDVLKERLCSSETKYSDSVAGLAVFRNADSQADRYAVNTSGTSKYMWDARWFSCRRGDREMRSESLRLPHFGEFPYDSQPFSNLASFELAFDAVKRVFNPQDHRYILITKSHGSRENALVPHLSVDLRSMIKSNPQKVVDAIKRGASPSTGLDTWKTDGMLSGVDLILKGSVAATDSATTTKMPEKGISKIDYLRILNKLGQVAKSDEMSSNTGIVKDGPMLFPIVLMESCKSDLAYSTDDEIKMILEFSSGYKGFNMYNVGKLYTSDDKGLEYDYINYYELKGFLANAVTDIQDLFMRMLDQKAKKTDK